MERLRSLIPEDLKRLVQDSDTKDLPITTFSLLTYLQRLLPFEKIIDDLTQSQLCGKSIAEAIELKLKANRFFLSEDYGMALQFYSKALRVAPMDAMDKGKNLVAVLYLNRATLLHRLCFLKACLLDCNRALRISPDYAKAWYRRGKANSGLGNLDNAVRDLHISRTLEFSIDGKRQIENELKVIEEQLERFSSKAIQTNDNCLQASGELISMKLASVTTINKGKCTIAPVNITRGDLIHVEEPYAAIISKNCRESHCHHCFCELPASMVPCTSCSAALYCSEECRAEAGGDNRNSYNQTEISFDSFEDLDDYVTEQVSYSYSGSDFEQFLDHRHECFGVSWPVVFPSDIVLAGRMIVKSGLKSSDYAPPCETQGLSHNYSHLAPEAKLELHIYAIVLAFCLERAKCFGQPVNGTSLSQVVMLISKVRTNCMAIMRMKSADSEGLMNGKMKGLSDLTSIIDQLTVGQAIYITGSLFNHSCQPNVHAYFLSRTLYIRAAESVAAGSHLELSYGPQVGELDCDERLNILAAKYFFDCQCGGCSGLNISDVAMNALRCINHDCSGVVLEAHKMSSISKNLVSSLKPSKEETRRSLEKIVNFNLLGGKSSVLQPGYCLKCGSLQDLKATQKALRTALACIQSLRIAINSGQVESALLLAGYEALTVLKSVLHGYNKRLAQTQDILAQACCSVGDLKSARNFCMESIKILETLYGPDHIVIGYELLKLATIEESIGKPCVPLSESLNKRLNSIFQGYYGSHAHTIFPQLMDYTVKAVGAN